MTASATTIRADELLCTALLTPEGKRDPYPLYQEIREIAPLYRSGLDGLWYASRYSDCRALLIDPRCGRPREGVVQRFGMTEEQVESANRCLRPTMLMQNPPEHTRLRGMVSRAFTPNRIAGMRERIEVLADRRSESRRDAGARWQGDGRAPPPTQVGARRRPSMPAGYFPAAHGRGCR